MCLQKHHVSAYCAILRITTVNRHFLRQNLYQLMKCNLSYCTVFNAVFNIISFLSQRPVHQSMLSRSSVHQRSTYYSFFKSRRLLSHITIDETMDSGERRMNPVTMPIISPRKEYWPSQESNQQPPVLKSYTLPTEQRDSSNEFKTMKSAYTVQ